MVNALLALVFWLPVLQLPVPTAPLLEVGAIDDVDAQIERLEKKWDLKVLRNERDLFEGIDANAMFFAPYSRLQPGVTDVREFVDRKHQEIPVLAFRGKPDRYLLMHEFIHFLIWKTQETKPVLVGKRKIHPYTVLRIEAATDKRKKLEYYHVVLGEELDNTRLMITYAKQLKLKRGEINAAYNYYHRSLRLLRANLVDLQDDLGKEEKYVDYEKRYQAAIDWYNAQDK